MLKLLSLFSGIGAFEKALDNIGVPYELVAFCEIDKYAAKSYCAIHGVDESMNLHDITKVDADTLPKDIDLVTYGFPCQDISLAGKQKGLFNEDGSQTRSGLFFDALRIIETTKPKIAIAENVKNLVGRKFNAQFQVVLASLESAGYNNYWAVLNAKDFGVPQNRERVFIVSIRKDIDTGLFEFPTPFGLKKRLRDVLEPVVDEKYYLSDEFMSRFLTSTQSEKYPCGNEYTVLGTTKAETDRMGTNSRHWVYDTEGCMSTLDATMYKQPKQILVHEPQISQVGQIYPNSGNPQAGRIYDADGLSPAMDTCSGGNRMPKVVVSEATKQGYAEAFEGDSVNFEQPNSTTRRGRVGHGVAQTLTTSPQQGVVVSEPTIARCVGGVGEKRSNGGQQWYQQDRVYQGDIALAHPASIPGGSYHHVVEEPVAYDEQNGYVRKDGCVGTLTTDGSSPKHNNRVVEPPKRLFNIYPNCGQAGNVYDEDCCAPCLPGFGGGGGGKELKLLHNLRIRKLTPKECFRLMGFDDESFHKAEAVNSNTQLYKQAGNSIVVDVLEELFCMMLDEDGNIYV